MEGLPVALCMARRGEDDRDDREDFVVVLAGTKLKSNSLDGRGVIKSAMEISNQIER